MNERKLSKTRRSSTSMSSWESKASCWATPALLSHITTQGPAIQQSFIMRRKMASPAFLIINIISHNMKPFTIKGRNNQWLRVWESSALHRKGERTASLAIRSNNIIQYTSMRIPRCLINSIRCHSKYIMPLSHNFHMPMTMAKAQHISHRAQGS